MNAFPVFLIAHIAFGSLAIFLGPIAMFSRKMPGFHPRIGEIYHWVMLGLCLTAAALAILGWARLRVFLAIALGSYAFALAGYLAAKVRFGGWLIVHVIGQGSSYIAMVTALFVVNWAAVFGEPGRLSFWAWVIPTLVGAPIIAWVTREVALGRRPKGITTPLR